MRRNLAKAAGLINAQKSLLFAVELSIHGAAGFKILRIIWVSRTRDGCELRHLAGMHDNPHGRIKVIHLLNS